MCINIQKHSNLSKFSLRIPKRPQNQILGIVQYQLQVEIRTFWPRGAVEKAENTTPDISHWLSIRGL